MNTVDVRLPCVSVVVSVMVGKSYLRYVPGPESGVVCSAASLTMDAAVLVPGGAPIVAVPALEYVCLWNSRTSTMVAKLRPPQAKRGKANEVSSLLLARDPLVPRSWLLIAGYVNGYVAVWRGKGEDRWDCVLYGLSHRPDSIVLSLDVHADGVLMATGGGDTDVTVWDLAADEPQYRLIGHRGGVVGLAFVAGAAVKTLISGAADGLIKVWSLEVQQCVQTIIASDTQVTALRADMAGSRLYVGVRDDVLKVYTLEQLHQPEVRRALMETDVNVVVEHGLLKRKTNKPVTSIVFNHDKSHLAIVTNKTVEIFRVLSAAEVKKKVQRKKRRRQDKKDKQAAPPVKANRAEGQAQAAPQQQRDDNDSDGDHADVADGEDAFQRTVAEEVVPLRIYHFAEKVRSLVFVPTKGAGSNVLRFAVASAANVVDIYDVPMNNSDDLDDDANASAPPLGDMKHRLAINSISHQNDIRHLNFTSNNMGLASVSSDCLKAWGTRNKVALDDTAADDAFHEEQREGHAPALPPLEKLLACTGSLTDSEDKSATEFTGGFVLLPGDHTAVIGTSDGKLLIASLQRAEVIERIDAHPPTAVTSLCTMANGAVVVSIGRDKRLLKWDVTLIEAKDKAASNGGTSTTAGAAGKVVSLMLNEEVELTETPLYVRCTPNDKLCAVAMQDHNIQVLYADTMKPFLTLYGHKLPVTSIAFSADSTLCASAGMDKSLRFWGLDFGDCHRSIHAHDDYITDVKFVGDSHFVWTASLDGSVKHWDGDTWTLIQTVRMHQRGVWCLAVNTDGTFVATAGVDKCIRTLMRTDQPLFPDEEQEREAQEAMDELAARDAAKQKLDDAAAAEVGVGGHKSVATAEAGEHLMEALDTVSIEAQRISDGSVGQPHAALRGRTVWEYLWGAIMDIRPSETRHALSSLTSVHVSSLLQYLVECLNAGVVTSYETASRVLVALVKPAPGSNTPINVIIGDDVSALHLLDKLQKLIGAGLQAERDRLGRNGAGLAFVQQSMQRHERITFYDKTKVQGAKRKFHAQGLQTAPGS
jgi:U3 small nucleolar RNA-associated protein 12